MMLNMIRYFADGYNNAKYVLSRQVWLYAISLTILLSLIREVKKANCAAGIVLTFVQICLINSHYNDNAGLRENIQIIALSVVMVCYL